MSKNREFPLDIVDLEQTLADELMSYFTGKIVVDTYYLHKLLSTIRSLTTATAALNNKPS